MTLSPQKFREIVFQILYSKDIGHSDEEAMLYLMTAELNVPRKSVKLAQDRVNQILDHLIKIDPLIASVSTSYDFDRIQTVTKNILRLGVFELLFDANIPPKVSIAEALRLARKFGSPESAAFVNAIMDHLYQNSLGNQVDTKNIEKQAQDLDQSEERNQQKALEKPSLSGEEEPE